MQNTNTTDDVVEIDLQELFGLLVHWLWLILICGIAAGAVGFAISNYVITPQYQSSTTVYIINKQNENVLTYSDVQLNSQLTKDYAQLIKSRTVLERVIAACTLEETYETLMKRVDVEMISDTRIISITVKDTDPLMAQYIANEIRKEASEQIKNVMDIAAVNVVDEANLPKLPYTPNAMKWTIIGLLVGLFLCAMILVIRYLMDDTIKTSDDIEKYLELSTLAMIPVLEEEEKKKHKKRRHTSKEPHVASELSMQKLSQDGDDLIVEELESTGPVSGKEAK